MRAAVVRDGEPATIEVENLSKSYGGRRVIDGVSFRVEPGATFAMIGPNGAGKTTTVEIVEGYRRPDGGRVRVMGRDPARGGREHRARVGIMLQGGGGIDPRLEAREAVALYARFHATPRDPDELLALCGLEAAARTRFRRLSGGERQRLGLALALVGLPRLVCLDEPTAGMDVEARAATRQILAALRADGVTVLLTSHDLGDVERLADRIAIIDHGRVVALGSPGELSSRAASVVRFRVAAPLTEPERLELVRAIRGQVASAALVDEESGRYRIDGASPTPALVALVAGWCAERDLLLAELAVGQGSLEDRYLELTGTSTTESNS